MEENKSYNIKLAEFQPLKDEKQKNQEKDIKFLSDVSLELKVELGSTVKTTKEILALEQDSIIKLGKIAGENVDVLFNNKKIASGEVVLVDEAYGIRITAFKK